MMFVTLQPRNFSFRLAQFEWKVSVHLLSLAPAFSLFLLIISECVAQYRGAIHVCAHAVIMQSHAWKPAFPILQSYIFPGNNMFILSRNIDLKVNRMSDIFLQPMSLLFI